MKQPRRLLVGGSGVEEAMMSSVPIPCPSCGFRTFSEPEYGSFGICPICSWEDCPVQLANPLDSGGPNRESLVEYQGRSVARWPLAVLQANGYERDSLWRPLSDSEVTFYRRATDALQKLAFAAVRQPGECYWNRRRD
jgi:hypothetical protein